MYNRYIPQPDGSYRKNRVPEPIRKEPQRHKPVTEQKSNSCPLPEQSPPSPHMHKTPRPPRVPPKQEHESIPGFFRHLLPRDIDTGDLLIIILLLLMAGDCEEDRNNALLTLALYFFM